MNVPSAIIGSRPANQPPGRKAAPRPRTPLPRGATKHGISTLISPFPDFRFSILNGLTCLTQLLQFAWLAGGNAKGGGLAPALNF